MTRSVAATARLLAAVLAAGALMAAPAQAAAPSRPVSSRAIQTALDHSPTVSEDLGRFYDLRHDRPAWTAEDAAMAMRAMENAAAEGLIPAQYVLSPPPNKPDAKAAAAWDLQLSAVFLRYARDLRSGRLAPAKVYDDASLTPAPFDAPAELNAALENDALGRFIAALPPPRPEYAFLRTALAYYRDLEARGDITAPVRAGEPLNGLAPEVREKLKARLQADDPGFAHESLAEGLRHFQARFGVEPTGRLTADTVALLRQPFSDRVLRIEANMERWRWLPRTPDKRYVEVNTPDATLKVIDKGEVVLASPVVLGRNDWATPLLATTAQAIVVNPPWHVPQDMAGEEILPKLVKDPGYLAAHNMVLEDGPPSDPHGRTINWRDVPAAAFPYHIQQTPGPRSGLGALMIDMPNNFGVYLHDTPDKQLFSRADRLLSHGCVRVREIAALASFALFGDTKAADRLPHPARTETQRIALDEPLPVYLLYWTAFKDAEGALAFRRDAYGMDVQLIAALYGKAPSRGGARPASQVADAGLPAP